MASLLTPTRTGLVSPAGCQWSRLVCFTSQLQGWTQTASSGRSRLSGGISALVGLRPVATRRGGWAFARIVKTCAADISRGFLLFAMMSPRLFALCNDVIETGTRFALCDDVIETGARLALCDDVIETGTRLALCDDVIVV